MGERAAVFDVMGTLFDLSSVRGRLSRLGAPPATLEAWFGRMLHTAASLTLVGEFRPFQEVARPTLETTLAQLELDVDAAPAVLQALRELPAYPDARPALERLAQAGIPIATLTNGGEEHTRGLLERGGLAPFVEAVITVEEVRSYKPHPAPYLHAAERLGVAPGGLTLVAAHAWDVVGARAAGLAAVWVDRAERRWPFPLPEPRRAAGLEEAAAIVAAD